jgi:uncharacterized protein YkwD
VKRLVLPLAIAACSGSRSDTVEAPSDAASAETTTAAPGKVPGGDDAKAFVEAHNRYRSSHCAPPLDWSADLAKVAQAWATSLAHSGCKLAHSKTNYGENIAAGTTGSIPPERAVELWYGESQGYAYGSATYKAGTGHFTQLVWKASRHVGCGTATCDDKQIWVCNYDPAGNFQGEFATNVDRPTCKK